LYVPATLAQPAAPLAPISITAVNTPLPTKPARTSLSVPRTDLNVLEGHAASVTGRLTTGAHGPEGWIGDAARGSRSGGPAGRIVALQALGTHGWRTLAHTRTGAHGRFRLRYVPRQTTSELVRLRFAGDAEEIGAHRRLGRLNVYRLAQASWYGGGGTLACGGALTSATMGVANKTLPCGTFVTLRYGGRSVRVAVIDRGPYVAGREFDLTQATKQALRFGDTGQVWSTR
jgi:rare lipoprotein A